MKQVSFLGWLKQAFELANKRPLLWLISVLLLAVFLAIGRVSLALGIVFSVSSLFLGVLIIKQIDQGKSVLLIAQKKQLTLAITLAVLLMLVWFVFRVIVNVQADETEKILKFFYDWELSSENSQDKNFRQLLLWLYSSAIVALIFVILMLNSFGSWFSFPLMAFKQKSWSEARDLGKHGFSKHASAMYQLTGFLLMTAFVGIGLVPLLTPLFYMLVSTLMYVSYKDIFE